MAASADRDLAEIESAMKVPEDGSAGAAIARDDVMRWMRIEDIHALGAVHALIHDRWHYTRIDPYLTFEDYRSFNLRYFERCIRENPDSEWADTRYSAGWGLVGWFKGLWKDKSTPSTVLAELRDWLRVLYVGGGEEIQECLITAVFEHLFDDRKIRKFFSRWADDPAMSATDEEASGYAAELRKREDRPLCAAAMWTGTGIPRSSIPVNGMVAEPHASCTHARDAIPFLDRAD